ncbi:MAG TPA: carboxyl transferase domain-containing protein, partial [Gaiellaceae bacterium]|nr:carboxyl transferase domain-containing protein [Gaiellaceae bacterium]
MAETRRRTHDTTEEKLAWLDELRRESLQAASSLPCERLEKLLDPGSFVELDRFVRHREVEFGMREKRPLG